MRIKQRNHSIISALDPCTFLRPRSTFSKRIWDSTENVGTPQNIHGTQDSSFHYTLALCSTVAFRSPTQWYLRLPCLLWLWFPYLGKGHSGYFTARTLHSSMFCRLHFYCHTRYYYVWVSMSVWGQALGTQVLKPLVSGCLIGAEPFLEAIKQQALIKYTIGWQGYTEGEGDHSISSLSLSVAALVALRTGFQQLCLIWKLSSHWLDERSFECKTKG